MEKLIENTDLQEMEPKCARCAEYEENVGALEILVMAFAFIGPIVGMLIGLRAAKKLLRGIQHE